MEWRLARVTGPRRIAVLASREDHCLLDLLWRASRGDLDAEVAVVVSNHETTRAAVEAFGVPFVHVPGARRTPSPRPRTRSSHALAAARCDTVVLARYMQILSGGLPRSRGACR